jgi:hypothetical protein
MLAGGKQLLRFRDQLNKINVFPVPDSDTGSNMAGTISAVMTELKDNRTRELASTTRIAADAALLGARGNSGAILAQFFHGLAEELHDRVAITTHAFGEAVQNAVGYAYSAMSEPKEGTILTVLKSWGTRFSESSSKTADLIHSLKDSLRAAQESLKQTREKLPSLKRANVVDAGALGFVHMLEGVYEFITAGRIKDAELVPEDIQGEEPRIDAHDGDITYRYCTECMVDGENIDSIALKEQLGPLGDSLIVAGSGTKARIHIHTDTPNAVFEIAQRFGTVTGEKADDMHKQYATAHTAHGDIALVVDSACDIPKELRERPYVTMVPLNLHIDERTYIDKFGLSAEDFYELLRRQPEAVPKTSQPTAAEYRKQYEFLASHYRHVYTVALSGALSGTYDAALRGIPKESESIDVFDSRNVTIALGLIVQQVIEAIDNGAGIREVKARAESLASRTRLLVAVPTVDWLVRGGRVSKSKARIAKIFGLVPIVTIDPSGHAVPAGVALSFKGALKRIAGRAMKAVGNRPIAAATAHVDNEGEARRLIGEIKQHCNVKNETFTEAASPVLASHTGFGTVALAFTELEDS